MRALRKSLYPLLLLAFVVGCRLGPQYKAPVVDTPIEWKETAEVSQGPTFEGLWWEVFDDEMLNSLEQQAVAGNPNLFVAIDRVAQARAIVGVDKAALYPQLNLNPSYTDTGTLFKIFLPDNGAFLPPAFPTVYRIHQLQYVMPLNMSYEVDLWGKVRGQFDSAVFNAQAQEENLQVTLLMLTTDLAVSYFKLRSFDTLTLVLENNLELLRDNLKLVQSRFKHGLISELDVVSAEQELSDNEAAYTDNLRQRALQEHAIAALLGMPASEFCLASMPLEVPPPRIQSSLPSQVLLQRPDLRAQERLMASQHALIGVAYASFFPAINLTGTLGFSSPDLKEFLRWKSRLWIMGVNAAQPIFDGGYNQAQLDLSYAQYNESLHTYQQKVLTAFQEVEDSLVNVEMQSKEYDSYLKSSAFADKRTKLAINRYTKGLSNYLDVLDSERSKIQADTNRVNMLGLRYISTVQLIKALGGSWSFSLQPAFEEPGRSCQGEDSNDGSGPDVAEDNIGRHIL